MPTPSNQKIIVDQVERRILLIRSQKVMLDSDLAKLYGIATKKLNQTVRRHIKRFPRDFMLQLTWEGVEKLSRSQFVTLKHGQNIKYRPYVFTEQGVAMLSCVLNSERAIQVNIAIMRVFVKLRKMLTNHKGLAQKLETLEKRYDAQFKIVFDAIRKLMIPTHRLRRRIGFHSQKR